MIIFFILSSELSAEENREIFDKCNNCHGHNYTVEITVKGKVTKQLF
jgi:6-pyruvoyl-tetrahydropterin synthase